MTSKVTLKMFKNREHMIMKFSKKGRLSVWSEIVFISGSTNTTWSHTYKGQIVKWIVKMMTFQLG